MSISIRYCFRASSLRRGPEQFECETVMTHDSYPSYTDLMVDGMVALLMDEFVV